MATFSPFGLQGDLSTSAASQANPTLLTFPWNPAFSGWSGDACISYLPGNGGNTVTSEDGYVYPAFIAQTGITIPSTVSGLWYPPIVGVITGFRYKPANNALTPNDIWPSYEKDTVLQPGTDVQVIVNTDAQARYKIQYLGTTLLPGLTKNYLFGGAYLGADTPDQYTQVVDGITFTFVRGTPNTSTSSAQGLEPGTSKMCLVEPATITANLLSAKLSRIPSAPLFILKPNNYDNSGWWDASTPTENTNTIVGVMLNQCFINTNAVPIFEQIPTFE